MPGGAVAIGPRLPFPNGPDGRRFLLLLDTAVAVALGAALLYANATDPMATSVTGVSAVLRIAANLVAAATVAVRRVDPRWSAIVATLSAALVCALGGAPPVCLCVAVSAYSAAKAGGYRVWWAAPAFASTLIAVAGVVGQVQSWLTALIANVAVVWVGWFAGQAARERHNRRLAAAERRAARERQHAAELRQAAIDERLVIARELHDIVGHSMSVIAVRAGVARVVMEQDPLEAKEALRIIETTTREALQEMRLLVAVLRQEDPAGPALAPAPGLANINALADQIRRAGVELEVNVRGAARALPPGVELSAFRIAQEALTNVVRHAGPTTAKLTIEFRNDDLLIEVTDQGPVVPDERAANEQHVGAAHGLIGMGERVALFDGQLRTGKVGTGFHVNAVLRTEESLR